MRKEALLIIDVQNDYFKNGRCELYQPEKALMAIKNCCTISERRNPRSIIFSI